MYRFPWYLTLVSTNHASSNPGLAIWAFSLLCALTFSFTPPPSPGIGLLQTNLHSRAQMDRLTPGIAQRWGVQT